MSDLLRFYWRIDKKGYEVVTLTRDMFEVEKLESGTSVGGGPVEWVAEPSIEPRAGQPKFLSKILGSGSGRREIEQWLGVKPELGWDLWIESGSIDKKPPHEVSWIVGKSGQVEPYALPPTGFGVFREFGDIDPDNENFVEFASKYGLLSGRDAEPVGLWEVTHRVMRAAIRLWQEGLKNGDLREASNMINRQLHGWAYHGIHVDTPKIELDAESHALRPPLNIRVSNLYQAIYLQLAQTVANDISLRHCDWCPTWFAYGPGTGKRKKARYCSDACRKAAWNAKKLEEESGRERRPK